MLYVFQVDTGTMMTFEMKLAMETVATLKRAIAGRTRVPDTKQVLLVSGGASLIDSNRVCSYSAGTDTSPIFFFARVNIESNKPQLPEEDEFAEIDEESKIDFNKMIENCISMAPNIDTLVVRTELAASLNNQATRQKEICERLVHEQHLQQQGWAAVVANLEDLIQAFTNKTEMLFNAFNEFLKLKQPRQQMLSTFKDVMETLDTIPILPTLIDASRYFTAASSEQTNPSSNTTSKQQTLALQKQPQQQQTHNQQTTKSNEQQLLQQSLSSKSQQPQTQQSPAAASTSANLPQQKTDATFTPAKATTLLQWIDYHDKESSLEKLADECAISLARFTKENADQIKEEVKNCLEEANKPQMKEIKGLEVRLYNLERLIADASQVVAEQNQIASSFQSNRERLVKTNDLSALPVLSNSHQRQTEMMHENYKKMCEYKFKCVKAKQELSMTLLGRLRWIIYIQQTISDLDGKLMIYKENLSRLNKFFDILDQVHRTPELYLESVHEAMRRRRFARSYLHWANSIVKKSQELYSKELEHRHSFDKKIGNHFLTNLFPGITRSYPPPFATILPDPFDTKLPRITAADIHHLRDSISKDLAEKLVIPKDVAMPHIVTISSSLAGEAEDIAQKIAYSNLPQEEVEDLDDRHSLNPTPPSSPQLPKLDSDV